MRRYLIAASTAATLALGGMAPEQARADGGLTVAIAGLILGAAIADASHTTRTTVVAPVAVAPPPARVVRPAPVVVYTPRRRAYRPVYVKVRRPGHHHRYRHVRRW